MQVGDDSDAQAMRIGPIRRHRPVVRDAKVIGGFRRRIGRGARHHQASAAKRKPALEQAAAGQPGRPHRPDEFAGSVNRHAGGLPPEL
jgi:hypothetical protein